MREKHLITIPEARVLGMKEGESFKEWCEKKGIEPHPLSLIAEEITNKALSDLRKESK